MSELTNRGGENRHRMAALAAAGLLALTLGGELSHSDSAAAARPYPAAETAAGKDPFSRHVDQGMTMILTGLKSLAHHKTRGIHHQRGQDSAGRLLDIYFYSQPSYSQPSRYDQVVCEVSPGQSVPEACGIFFGSTSAKTLDQAFKNGTVLSRAMDRPNSFKLEQVTVVKQGASSVGYLKNGNKYLSQTTAADGSIRSHTITAEIAGQVYDDFIGNAVDMLKSAGQPAA